MSTSAAFWDARFATDEYIYGTQPNRFLVSQAHRLSPGMTVLSIADGEGRNSVWLAEQGLKVHATDVSPVAVGKARQLAAQRHVSVQFTVADLAHWESEPDHYDVVVGIFIQFAAPDLRKRIFEIMQKSLKPGGLLLLQGYRTEQLAYGTGGPPLIENLYTRSELENAFRTLEILHLQEHETHLNEGSGHRGLSAVIDLVAKKPNVSD